MYIRAFEDFYEKMEEFLRKDPFRVNCIKPSNSQSRVVLKYRPGDNKVMFKITNDLQTITIKFDQTEDAKKIEMLLVKSSEILANFKYSGADFSKFISTCLNPRRWKKKEKQGQEELKS